MVGRSSELNMDDEGLFDFISAASNNTKEISPKTSPKPVRVNMNSKETNDATSSPSLWRKFSRKISTQDHNKAPVAYVKPSRPYSDELINRLEALHDAYEEEEEEGELEKMDEAEKDHGSVEIRSDQNSINFSNRVLPLDFYASLEAENVFEEVTTRMQVSDSEVKRPEVSEENKIEELTQIDNSRIDNKNVGRASENEYKEPNKEKKLEKKSRGKARSSKKSKVGYQRSMSEFNLCELNDIDFEDRQEEKEENKKSKFSRASLRKKKKNSTPILPFSMSERKISLVDERRKRFDDKEMKEEGDKDKENMYGDMEGTRRRKTGSVSLEDEHDPQLVSEKIAEKFQIGNEHKSEKNSSKGRQRKSKKTKAGYQRSMSAFSMFEANNEDDFEKDDSPEEKEEKKKEKFARASLRKKQKNSTPILPKISVESEPGSLGQDRNEDNSLEIPGVQLRPKKNSNGESIFNRLSWRRSTTNIPNLHIEAASQIQTMNSNVVNMDDNRVMQPKNELDRKPDSPESLPPDSPIHKLFGSQPSIAITESSECIPDCNQRKKTGLKSFSPFHSDKKDPNIAPSSLLHAPKLSTCRSLTALNEASTIENNLSPHRKFAITATSWDGDLSNPSEEEAKTREKEKDKGIKDKFFDFKKKKLTSTTSNDSISNISNLKYPNNTNDANNNSTNNNTNDQHDQRKNSKTTKNNAPAEKKQKSSKRGFVRRFTTGPSESILHNAIKNSDVDALQKLLQDANNRTEINTTKAPGVTIFHQACVFGDVQIIQMLLSNGADVNLKTWSKLSPVKIAVSFGHYEAAKLLLESGADQMDIINGYQEEESSFVST